MAIGPSFFNNLGGAVNDIFFAPDAYRAKATGDRLEAENYDRAGVLARQNEQFTRTSTEIKQAQLDREIYNTIGGQRADVAAAGFTEGGSALDLLRASASQGALTRAVAGQQGLITEAGYEEQAQSYDTMAKTARLAADAQDKAADSSLITGLFKGAGALLSLFPGGAAAADVVSYGAKSAMGDPTGLGGLY